MKKVCPTCGGSGEIGFFQGVSRFLLSREECPHCSGTGYVEEKKADSATNGKKGRQRKSPAGKKKN